MHKTKILHVINSLGAGGAERVVSILATNLNNNEFESLIITLRSDASDKILQEIKNKGIKIYSCDFRNGFSLKNHLKLKRLIQKIKPDIVHGHLQGLIAAFPWAKILRVRQIVYTVHSDPYYDKKIRNRVLQSIFFHLGTVAVCISNDSARKFKKLYGKHSEVITNCIDTENYRHNPADRKIWRKKLGIFDDDFVLIAVANFYPVKNHTLLIKAFATAFPKDNNVRLILVGDGPEKEYILKAIRTYKVEKRVILTGYSKDVSSLLSASDCFVLGSSSEGCPVSLLEAISSGLPTIVSNTPGMTEIVEDHKNGLVFPPDDLNKFVSTLKEIRENNNVREKMSKDNVLLSTKYHQSKMVKEYKKLYLDLLADKDI